MMIGNLTTSTARIACALLTALILTACDSSSGGGWTFAPLGPTQSPGASDSPTESPAGQVIEVVTTDANPLAFEPATLNAPADTLVTVIYNNDNSLEHNINFFDGPDQNSPSLGATERVIGPDAPRSVTFTTPSAPGDYYFWCDVHLAAMAGTLRVE